MSEIRRTAAGVKGPHTTARPDKMSWVERKLKASEFTDPPGPYRGDEGWVLSAEDEAILDRVWAEVAKPKLTVCGTMNDEETLKFFGLSDEN